MARRRDLWRSAKPRFRAWLLGKSGDNHRQTDRQTGRQAGRQAGAAIVSGGHRVLLTLDPTLHCRLLHKGLYFCYVFACSALAHTPQLTTWLTIILARRCLSSQHTTQALSYCPYIDRRPDSCPDCPHVGSPVIRVGCGLPAEELGMSFPSMCLLLAVDSAAVPSIS